MDLQLALPLEADARNESSLRQAWARSGLSLPYEIALRDRALEICLRCYAEAMRKATCGSASRKPRKHARKQGSRVNVTLDCVTSGSPIPSGTGA